MKGDGWFVIGVIIGLLYGMFVADLSLNKEKETRIRKACQGTPWVIEEALIKKTLTCVVEVKK